MPGEVGGSAVGTVSVWTNVASVGTVALLIVLQVSATADTVTIKRTGYRMSKIALHLVPVGFNGFCTAFKCSSSSSFKYPGIRSSLNVTDIGTDWMKSR